MKGSNGNCMYKKVMIIDDTYVDRYVAERNIKKYAFAEEVIAKESAEAALEYLSLLAGLPQELPQLIFLDIRMPVMDGFGFLSEYEKLPDSVRKNCIIMMLTTSLNPDDHNRANANPYVQKFLNKPLNREQLGELCQNEKAYTKYNSIK